MSGKGKGVIFSQESFAMLWPEVDGLGRKHFAEVNEKVLPQRQYNLDVPLMMAASASGRLLIHTAREEGTGKLLGYLTTTLQPDVESQGLWMAEQGAWFVSPFAPPRTAIDLFSYTLSRLRSLGFISYINLHHHFSGRGKGLGKFFIRRGAKVNKIEYSLWLGA